MAVGTRRPVSPPSYGTPRVAVLGSVRRRGNAGDGQHDAGVLLSTVHRNRRPRRLSPTPERILSRPTLVRRFLHNAFSAHSRTIVRGAMLGATIVIMSGGLNQHIGTIAFQTAACLPIALYVTRRLLDRPSASRTITLAVVYAAIALASFPPILMWVFGVTAVYVLFAFWLDERSDLDPPLSRVALRWAVATVLAIGLVAFFYVPALALRESAPYIVSFYQGVGLESMPLVKVLQLLSPTLMGGVPIYVNSPVPGTLTPNIPYVGVVALVAALLATPMGGSRARVLFYASTLSAVLILMKLFGIPPVQWITCRYSSRFITHYFGIALSFLIAFLAAIGLEALLKGSTGVVRALVAVGLSLAVTESLWFFVREFNVLKSSADSYWIRDWRALNGLTVLSVLAVTMGACRRSLRWTVAAALVLLAAVEGMYNNMYPSPAAWNIFDHPVPYVLALKREAGMRRVLPFGALNANLNSAFEIFSFDSLMTINPPRAYELYWHYMESPPWLFMREAKRIPPGGGARPFTGINFLLVRDAFPELVNEAKSRGYSVRFNDGYVWLFERPTPPRFLFSSEYRVLPPSSMLNAIGEGTLREILLETRPGTPTTPNRSGDPDVHLEAYHRNSLTLAVDAPRPGIVYAADSFFDGWTATVNGRPTTIIPANYAFRAVEVPAGHSRIEFRYWPPGLTLGLVTSCLSAGLLAAFASVLRMRSAAGGT